jgi:hypothetical protein
MAGVFNPTSCNAEIYLGDTVIGEVVGNGVLDHIQSALIINK